MADQQRGFRFRRFTWWQILKFSEVGSIFEAETKKVPDIWRGTFTFSEAEQHLATLPPGSTNSNHPLVN